MRPELFELHGVVRDAYDFCPFCGRANDHYSACVCGAKRLADNIPMAHAEKRIFSKGDELVCASSAGRGWVECPFCHVHLRANRKFCQCGAKQSLIKTGEQAKAIFGLVMTVLFIYYVLRYFF